VSTQPFPSVPVVSRASWPRRAPSRLEAYAALCAVSFVCYIAGRLTDGGTGILFSLVGAGACGWAWLLTRALFDPAPRDVWWPRMVATVVAVAGALTVLAPTEGGLYGFAGNVYGLSGSAAMLLTFIEPFQPRRGDIGVLEKRFRLAFLAIYAAQLVTVLGSGVSSAGPAEAWRTDLIRIACCVVGLVGASAAVWYRLRHPLVPSDGTRSARRTPTEEDRRLAERLERLLRDEAIDARSDLRIGDVAARLGQPEYKVSQCISTVLGFPNFNRLINHHRIERAKRLLADPDQGQPILDVAFECGFGSVGPFNRAFRAQVGVTPRAFRAASRRPS
jgi:AraC-like DNA-binding protein